MSTNFKVTLAQSEADASTIAVPDTGANTNYNDSGVAAVGVGIAAIVFVLAIAAIAVVKSNRKHRNFGGRGDGLRMSSKKSIIIGLSTFVLVLGAFGLICSRQDEEAENVSASAGAETLAISMSGFDMSVVPSADGTFKSAAQTIKVTTATDAGYNLGVYADSADLVNTAAEKNNVISGIAASENLATLSTNTWGIATTAATDATSKVWQAMPAVNTSLITLKNTTAATAVNDETTVYYGVNVNTDLAYGDYVNTINYVAVANPVTMQEFTSVSCNNMAIGDTAILTDSRDSNKYTIGKLVDGKCWMLDNLALDIANSNILNNLSEDNTHAVHEALDSLKNGSGTASDKYATARPTYWSSGTGSFTAPLINMASKNLVPSDPISTAGGYKVGGYYNYCAASAGSYCYSSGASAGNGAWDICPKNWRIPTGGVGGEYHALERSIEDYTAYRTALHLPLSGDVSSDGVQFQGKDGDFWSSTVSDDGFPATLSLDGDLEIISTTWTFHERAFALPVRCIIRY